MNSIDYLKKYYKGNIDEGLKRLDNGEPIQYIVGNVDFYGYIYDITKDVLIPRFETEELVDKTIKYIDRYFDDTIDILDLGTGSGCIGITLSMQVDSKVTAVDISDSALEVAHKNASKYNQKIIFIKSNMLDKVDGLYDVIISNPPYIDKDEVIEDIVKNNEPAVALYADNHGLYYYEYILSKASKNLKNKSLIAFEIGYKQGPTIKDMALKYFPDSRILIEKDMEGNDRFIFVFNQI